jgi:hypothetical protein
VEDHAFRQTQTAITVWTFVEEGIAPFAYQTPVFGPPWRLPFELPLFQIAAALLARAGVANLDVACRLTNLGFFYASALLLYALCRMHFRARAASGCILIAYAWLPYTIFWSRTSMIDYCSVFLALGYAVFFLRWLRAPERAGALAIAVAFGCLAVLVKATTVVTVAVLLSWSALRRIHQELGRAGGAGAAPLRQRLSARRALLAGLVAASVIPLLVGHAWEGYAQRVRSASPATEWFSPSNLALWYYGTWQQRADPRSWSLLAGRLWSFTPGAFALLPLLGAWRALAPGGEGRAFAACMLCGGLAAVATFFNLYLEHNYYLMAVSPTAAILAGLGFHFLCFEILRGAAWRAIASGLALGALLWSSEPYLARPFSIAYQTEPVCRLGQRIREVTPPDEHVIVRDHPRGWSPEVLYYARRKGLMLWGSALEMEVGALNRLLRENRFTTLVSRQPRPDLPSAGQVGGFRIYKLGAAAASAPAARRRRRACGARRTRAAAGAARCRAPARRAAPRPTRRGPGSRP